MTLYVDADDFCGDNHRLDVLFNIKLENPAFCITLFAIPMRCSAGFLEGLEQLDWLDLVPHGFNHPHAREMQDWDYQRCDDYLTDIEPLGWTRGFKAPGWQISDGMYRALLERDYWVADQHYNDHRRPPELHAVFPDDVGAVHCHIGHLGGHNDNEIGYSADYLAHTDEAFGFLRDRT